MRIFKRVPLKAAAKSAAGHGLRAACCRFDARSLLRHGSPGTHPQPWWRGKAPATCHGHPALCRSPEAQRNPSADVSMDRQPVRPGSFHGPRIVQSLSRRLHPGTGRRGDPPQSRRHPPRHRALAGCGTSCKNKTHPSALSSRDNPREPSWLSRCCGLVP